MEKNKKKKVLGGAIAFAVVALVAATFAWFTSEDKKTNHFEGQIATGKDIEVVETFEPPTDWEPGAEVNKNVAVANIGKYNTLIRVGLGEKLELLADYEAHATTGSEIEGKTKAEVYLVPGTQVAAGYTASTFDGEAPKITIAQGDYKGTYTLKVFEKAETVNQKTTYTYRYVFDSNGVLYYAAGIDGFTRDATNKIKIKSGTPSLSYVSLTYGQAEIKNWNDPASIYNPTFTAVGSLIWNAPAATGGGNIQISFNNITTDPTVANKWYFNSADGYFYYTSVVAPGVNTTQLVDAVKLLGSANNTFSKLKYDLTVTGQGIAAYKDAVNSWLPAGVNDPLATALKALVPEK